MHAAPTARECRHAVAAAVARNMRVRTASPAGSTAPCVFAVLLLPATGPPPLLLCAAAARAAAAGAAAARHCQRPWLVACCATLADCAVLLLLPHLQPESSEPLPSRAAAALLPLASPPLAAAAKRLCVLHVFFAHTLRTTVEWRGEEVQQLIWEGRAGNGGCQHGE
jgi:hypothetical protein